MSIFIDGILLKDPKINLRNIDTFLKVYGSYFQQEAEELKTSCLRTVALQDAVLYVNQREFAVLRDDSSMINGVGSDMATTCHMVVVRCPKTKVTALGHFDGVATSQGVNDLINATLEEVAHIDVSAVENIGLDLHIIGGFNDSRKTSEDLSKELLNEFNSYKAKIGRSKVKFHLRTFCASSLNNIGVAKESSQLPLSNMHVTIDSPAILGIVVNIKTGNLCRATFEENAREPLSDLRGSRSLNGVKFMTSIYRPRENYFIVEPFTYEVWENIEDWLRQPDCVIRRYMSTSPDVEPENFENHIRRILRFIRDNPNPSTTVFENGNPIILDPVLTDEGLFWNRRIP